MPETSRAASNLQGLAGAVAGGAFGYALFFWIAGQGFYALAIPGALVGLGCGLLARHPSRGRGVACGVAALVLCLVIEWRFRPFVVDPGFPYFLRHLGDLTGLTKLMVAVGAVSAFWFGKDAGLAYRARR